MSSSSLKPLFLMQHLGLTFDSEVVDLAKGAQRAPEFLALNPMGKVPVLVDGDFVLWESHAILDYLAPDELRGRDRKERAEVTRWLSWTLMHLTGAIAGLNYELGLKKMLDLGAPDMARVEALKADRSACLAVLDAAIGPREWLLDRLTLVEFAISPLLATHPGLTGLDLAEAANVQRWLERVAQVEGWPLQG